MIVEGLDSGRVRGPLLLGEPIEDLNQALMEELQSRKRGGSGERKQHTCGGRPERKNCCPGDRRWGREGAGVRRGV